MWTPVEINAQPSILRLMKIIVTSRTITDAMGMIPGLIPILVEISVNTYVLIASRITAIAATMYSFLDTSRARSRSSPSSFNVRKFAPCSRNTETIVIPPINPNGLSSVNRLPVYIMFWSIGTPRARFANAVPSKNDGRNEPIAIILSKRLRQAGFESFERYSNEMPRRMRPITRRNNAR